MAFCGACGQKIKEGAGFCAACGARVEGALNPPQAMPGTARRAPTATQSPTTAAPSSVTVAQGKAPISDKNLKTLAIALLILASLMPAIILRGVALRPEKPARVSAPKASGSASGGVALPDDAPNAGFAVLGFFFPMVGLILFLVWKDQYPLKAKSCGKGALISVIVGAVTAIVGTVLIIALGYALFR